MLQVIGATMTVKKHIALNKVVLYINGLINPYLKLYKCIECHFHYFLCKVVWDHVISALFKD